MCGACGEKVYLRCDFSSILIMLSRDFGRSEDRREYMGRIYWG